MPQEILDQPIDPQVRHVMEALGRIDARLDAAADSMERRDLKLDTVAAKIDQNAADMRVYVATDAAAHDLLNIRIANLSVQLGEAIVAFRDLIGDDEKGIKKRLRALEDFQARQKYTLRGAMLTASAVGSGIGGLLAAAGLFLGRGIR